MKTAVLVKNAEKYRRKFLATRFSKDQTVVSHAQNLPAY